MSARPVFAVGFVSVLIGGAFLIPVSAQNPAGKSSSD